MNEVFDYSAVFGLMWFLQILDTLHWATKKREENCPSRNSEVFNAEKPLPREKCQLTK